MPMPRSVRLLSVLVLLLTAGALAAEPPAPSPAPLHRLAVRAGRLIDGTGAAPVRDAVILIEGDRITAVGPGLAIPPGTEVVDLSHSTVLPGLIDCHTHITSQSGD